jgi:hypothetical protein
MRNGEPLTRKLALWVPTWYNLDQTVTSGQSNDYIFFVTIPDLGEDLQSANIDLVFFNSLMGDPTEWATQRFLVASIRHPELGELEAIRTDQFGSYKFYSAAGRMYEVEAEQNPGWCYDPSVTTAYWACTIELMLEDQESAKAQNFLIP